MSRLVPRTGLLAGLVALVAVPGCKTSDANSAAQAIGAAYGINTSQSAAERGANRAVSVEADLDPGYERYLYRLGARRQARGMVPPAELRVAMRRERYQSVVEMLAQAGSVAARTVSPMTRHIPYVNAEAVSKTAITDPFLRPKKDISDVTKLASVVLFRTP